MKKRGKKLLLLALPLCLTACAVPQKAAPDSASTPPAALTAPPAPEVTAPPAAEPEVTAPPAAEPEVTAPPAATAPEITAAPTAKPDPVAETIFPRSFSFMSGAGGWSTELEVAADGSFTGLYHDSEMGDTGEEYPNGTVYICHFSGKFSQPVKVDDFTYSVRLESIEQEETEEEEIIEDGVRYIGSSPYGLDDADELLIYLPGSQRQDLPEGFVNWTWAFGPWDTEDELSQEGTDKLTQYGLYNVSGEQGFVSVGE